MTQSFDVSSGGGDVCDAPAKTLNSGANPGSLHSDRPILRFSSPSKPVRGPKGIREIANSCVRCQGGSLVIHGPDGVRPAQDGGSLLLRHVRGHVEGAEALDEVPIIVVLIAAERRAAAPGNRLRHGPRRLPFGHDLGSFARANRYAMS